MKQQYIRTFMKNEKEILNKIEKDHIRKSTMSVYSYLIKLFSDAGTEELELSLRDFLKKYKHHHEKISRGTLVNRFNKLAELGLLKVTKVGQKHVYKLDRFLDSFLDSKNSPQTTEITSSTEDSQIPKSKSLDNIYNIYINSEADAELLAKDVIKELKVKSKWVKNSLIATIKERYKTINIAGAKAYIRTIVLKLQAISESIYTKTNAAIMNNKKFISAKNINKKQLKFTNYKQREYDYKKLEDEVLGWY